MAHGNINHVEFPADNPERAMRFYAAIAGWEFGEQPGMPGYHLFESGQGYGGAIGQRGVAVGPALRLYIEVNSIEDALAASAANGGTTLEPKTEIPGWGWFAVVKDPEGTDIGLFQALPRG